MAWCARLEQKAPSPSVAQFAVDDPKFRIQPIQYSKTVWIDNMDATHSTFRHWAMGLRTGPVDGGIFIHNISVDTRNIATSNQDVIRQLAIALPAVAAASAGLIDDRF